jgi:hypothetical protein
MTAEGAFDRSLEDVSNIIHLEHVNLAIADQRLATIFYGSGLGLTRDPYLMTGVTVMWMNAGASQFHLPLGRPQHLRGHVGLVVPDLVSLLRRLSSVQPLLSGTQFSIQERADHIATTCPWGNAFRCYASDAQRFGDIRLGIPYVEFSIPPGCAEPIVEFYRRILDAPGRVETDGAGARVAHISAGIGQSLLFRETSAPIPAYDGHHIQIYVHNFSKPHKQLLDRGLVTEECDQHQFRFSSIVDLSNGHECFAIEHEVRSMRHPLYGRPLVNRNPDQSNRNYTRGRDSLAR